MKHGSLHNSNGVTQCGSQGSIKTCFVGSMNFLSQALFYNHSLGCYFLFPNFSWLSYYILYHVFIYILFWDMLSLESCFFFHFTYRCVYFRLIFQGLDTIICLYEQVQFLCANPYFSFWDATGPFPHCLHNPWDRLPNCSYRLVLIVWFLWFLMNIGYQIELHHVSKIKRLMKWTMFHETHCHL